MCENEYEAERNRRLIEHKQMLESLGLLEDKNEVQQNLEMNGMPVKQRRRRKSSVDSQDSIESFIPRRFSARIRSQIGDLSFLTDEELDSSDTYSKKRTVEGYIKKKFPKRINVYGAVEGVDIGKWWSTRMECSYDGIHRPPVNGIHVGLEGAYSVALSGNYEDDIDGGNYFTYTGSGGRDLRGTKQKPKNLRTAPQSRDQTCEGANASLIKSVTTKNPVRVIRGYKLLSKYAPKDGYRYDGLYMVEKYWTCTGKSGFLVYKFAMKRLPNQPPPPWEDQNISNENNDCEHKQHYDSQDIENTSHVHAIDDRVPAIFLEKLVPARINNYVECVQVEEKLNPELEYSNCESDKENTDKEYENESLELTKKRNNSSEDVCIVNISQPTNRKRKLSKTYEDKCKRVLVNDLRNADVNEPKDQQSLNCSVSKMSVFYEKSNFSKRTNNWRGWDKAETRENPTVAYVGLLLHDLDNARKINDDKAFVI